MTYQEALDLILPDYDFSSARGGPGLEACRESCRRLTERLLEVNTHVNLTAITDPEGVAIKHFADSWSLLPWLDQELAQHAELRVLDIGSGAGFPGLPLLIARPGIRLSLLDALRKRCRFLEESLTDLGLSAEVCHGRAEDLGREADRREAYDFVTARAVAELRILLEYALPFLKVGGLFVALKGPDQLEAAAARQALHSLGGKLAHCEQFELPGGQGSRSLYVIRKVKACPSLYPRSNALIRKRPL